MRQQYKIICLFILFISKYSVESTTAPPDWWGDPKICTTNNPITPSPLPAPPLPQFTNYVEFSLESVIIHHRLSAQSSTELDLHHYVYNYDKNTLAVIENRNGTSDSRFYNYKSLRESIYYFQDNTCHSREIQQNHDTNGRSAIDIGNNTWHIRPMNEFLLFSSNHPDRQVTPVYIGNDTIRGIRVDKWQSCYIDRTLNRTEKRVWAFAQRGVEMPSGIVGDIGIPVQAIINSSIIEENNVQRLENDIIFNIISYEPYLTEPAYPLTPPKGVMCDKVPQEQLVTLKNVGIHWPSRFDVRIEISTSRSSKWERFHLFYHQGDDDKTSRLRYDYLPEGAEDYKSVIHDYTDNLTYSIDRRLGTCEINRGVEISDIDPFRYPIEFFVKNEATFIFNPPENAWEDKGFRSCRTNSIECAVYATSKDNFPPIIDPDTGKPTGETWKSTVFEYAWARRSPNTHFPGNRTRQYDYPVSLYLKLFRNGSPNNHFEDIEYEFYEMSHDGNLNQFDISTCYRSLNYSYLHLVFILKLNRGNIIDGNHLNRRRFYELIHYELINRMQIRYSRITDLEIDHEQVSNDVAVFFTLLGQTPKPESETGFDNDESTAEQARDIIKEIIDDGEFEFEMRLDDNSEVSFRGEPNSLKSSKQFMSTHSLGKKVINQPYTIGSQILAIVVGLLIGLIFGIILAGILRHIRKDPMPRLPASIANPLPSIDFHSRETKEPTSDA